MYDPIIETAVDPHERAIREKTIPSMLRRQVQKRELELIRMQQEQTSRHSRQSGLGARFASWWTAVTAQPAGRQMR